MRAVRASVCVLGLILAAPTHAQTTTNCQWIGNQLTCQSQNQGQSSFWSDYMRSLDRQADRNRQNTEQALRMMEQRRQNEAAQAATQAQAMKDREAAYLRQEVGKLIAAGQCTEARNMALRYGDLDLAERIVSLCAQ